MTISIFDYIDDGFLLIALLFLLFFIAIIIIVSKDNDFTFIPIVVVFIIVFTGLTSIGLYDRYFEGSQNIQYFKKRKTLICTMKPNTFRVSVKTGWKLQKNYFYNDIFLIRADHCKRLD